MRSAYPYTRAQAQLYHLIVSRGATTSEVSLGEWTLLLAVARATAQASKLASIVLRTDTDVPDKVRFHLRGAINQASAQITAVNWEVSRLRQAFLAHPEPVMILKGAAYVSTGLPFASFRLTSDVDILTRLPDLRKAVTLIKLHGWDPIPMSAYDEKYFSEWMHELPPFQHSIRGTFLDIHHALLPRTSRLQPDTEKVWERAVQLPDSPLLVPCPEDMVLHCAFHAYHQGEFDNAPRDVIDMFDLLSHFTRDDPEFWGRLVDRAVEIGVVPPLWHALSVTQFIFDIGPPVDVQAKLDSLFPRTWSRDFVQRLIRRVTSYPVQTDAKAARAQQLLHARSHYLRMPLPILARHLATKSYFNWQRSREAAKAQKAHLEQFKQ